MVLSAKSCEKMQLLLDVGVSPPANMTFRSGLTNLTNVIFFQWTFILVTFFWSDRRTDA